MQQQLLSPLQMIILRCLVKKIIDSIPDDADDLGYQYKDIEVCDDHLVYHCERILQDTELWNSLPFMISTSEKDFVEAFAEIKSIGGEAELVDVDLHHTSFSKEALEEDLKRYFKLFHDTMSVIELEELLGQDEDITVFSLFSWTPSSREMM